MRELTREEQLEYLIDFLENQIEAYQYDLEQAKVELDNLKGQKLERMIIMSKINEYFNSKEYENDKNEKIIVDEIHKHKISIEKIDNIIIFK